MVVVDCFLFGDGVLPDKTATGYFLTGDGVALDITATGFFRFEVDLDSESSFTLNNLWFFFKIVEMFPGNRVGCSDNHPAASSTICAGILIRGL